MLLLLLYRGDLIDPLSLSLLHSSKTTTGQFYHVGTVANKKNEIFVADLRMMVCATDDGWIPLVIYARRARKPLVSELNAGASSSWDMLGTNLSVKQGDEWTTETTRLFLMDRRDFNQLGLGIGMRPSSSSSSPKSFRESLTFLGVSRRPV